MNGGDDDDIGGDDDLSAVNPTRNIPNASPLPPAPSRRVEELDPSCTRSLLSLRPPTSATRTENHLGQLLWEMFFLT